MLKPIAALLAIGLMLPATSLGVRILTPPEHSTIGSDYVYVVGTTSAPRVELWLNDVKVVDCVTKDSMFHARVNFGYGLNDITAIPLDSAGFPANGSTQLVEVLFAPQLSQKYKRIYPEYRFHGSSTEAQCGRCHPAERERGAPEEITAYCLECHASLKAEIRRHTMSDSCSCIVCHERPAGAAFAQSQTDSSCFRCHEKLRGMFSQEYVHGPVAGGSCRICHNPHGSPYDKALNHPVQILCFSCHGGVERQLRRKVVHRPFLEGRCTACHDSHATANRWVLTKNSQEICLTCHRFDQGPGGHNHPYNVRPRRPLEVTLQLSVNGQLECLSCHQPHSGDAEHLMRVADDYTCATCHEEKE